MATWQPPVPTEMTPLDFRGIPSVAQPPQDPPPAPTQDPPPKPPCGEPIIEGIEYRRDDAEFKWLRLPTKTTRVFHEGTHVYFRPIVQCGKCDKYECSADVNYTASISPSAKGGGFRPRKVLNEGENESGPRWNDYYVNPWGSFDLDVQVSVSCTFGESCERSKTAKTSFKAKWRDLDKEPEPK
jgi:hypothetical protein